MESMSDDKKSQLPYQTLGARLKRLREKSQESLAEVSGAVEIDIHSLEDFELGGACPEEEILLLLISHFNMRDEEANKLWRLAGYDQQDLALTDDAKSSVFVLPADARVNYTDMANIITNEFGVTINFMQSSGPGGQAMIVSRLGMSKEHAQSLIELLQHSLSHADQSATKVQKALPAPKRKTDRKEQ